VPKPRTPDATSKEVEVGDVVENVAVSIEDNAGPSSSSSNITIYADGGSTMHGYTAAQFAALAPVNGLDLMCKVCHRLMVDPLSTICGHTMCTRCFNLSTLNNKPEPCPICGHVFGPVSIWYYTLTGYANATKSVHLSRNALLEEYFTSPMVRGRFDCINQIMEMTDPKEVYDLFRDIFWYFKHPENHQLIQRAYAHTFLRLMSMKMKKRINEEIKRVFQMEVELGYLNRYNNFADANLMKAFIENFPDRAEKSKSIFTTKDESGNSVTRCTIFPDYYPEKMVLTHLPCNQEPTAIVCTVPEALPVDHGVVEVTTSQIVPAVETNEDDNVIAVDDVREPFAHFVRVSPKGKQRRYQTDRPSTSTNRLEEVTNGASEEDEQMDTSSPSASTSAAATAEEEQRVSETSEDPDSPLTVSYFCGGSMYNHAKPVNCPPIMAKHPCLHSECCQCGLGVGIQQYYSVLSTPRMDGASHPPVALAKQLYQKDEATWDPECRTTVALSNSSYPMLTTEYLNDRMNGLIEKQEEEALKLYEKIRDSYLKGQLVEIGEEAYSEGGFDMFTNVGNYLEQSSKYLRMDKITEFPYKHGHCVSCLDFDTSGSLLAIGGTAKSVRIFDFDEQLRDYNKYSPITGATALVEIPALSKLSGLAWCKTDAQNLVMTEYDGVAVLYDVHENKDIRRYKDHNRRIWDVTFHHNIAERKFATCGDDGKVFVYKTTGALPIQSIDVDFSATSLEFSPWDENQLAVAVSDATVNIYDIRHTRHTFMQLRGHKKAVSYVRYLDCGAGNKRLLSAAIDSSIQMWDMSMGKWKCERTFKGHVNEKNFTGLTTNGQYFVTGSEGNDIVLYHQLFSKPMATTNFLTNAHRDYSEFDEQHDRNDFVSCLKWKKGTNIFVAGNNQGIIQAYKAH
ncbi:hypothetical protein PENTCL1PPCAC_26349, partial [Pristionchus entomophagus]